MSDYDEAYDRGRDAGLDSDEAADYAFDVWRGYASPRMSDEDLYWEYDRT